MIVKCDRCGRHVPAENNVASILAILERNINIAFTTVPRHFLPVLESGQVVCEGSPSVAQYIEGQSLANDGYQYRKDIEGRVRSAHRTLIGAAARAKN